MTQNVEENDPMKMRTIVLIPTEPAPEDPSWLIKKHSHRKLDPIEIEEYFSYEWEKDHKFLVRGRDGWVGVPSRQVLIDIIYKYHNIKKHCIQSAN